MSGFYGEHHVELFWMKAIITGGIYLFELLNPKFQMYTKWNRNNTIFFYRHKCGTLTDAVKCTTL